MMLVIHMLSTCYPHIKGVYSHEVVGRVKVGDFSYRINPCTFARSVAPEI